MTYVVAVDGGGTSTRSVVADRSGRCLGFAKTGSGNPVSAGEAVAAAAFAASLDAALTQAGVAAADVDCLLFSMAGSFTGAASPALAERLRGLGFRVTPAIEGDLLGVFCSGAAELTGYTLEAGTGSGAVRVEDGRIARTADGLGWLLGDEGSGFWFGHAVVRAACADLDRRGPATALTSLVLAEAGVTLDWSRAGEGRPAALPALMGYVYDLRPVQLSRFARLAFEAGDDPVAAAIVQQGATALARTLSALVKPEVTGPVVVGGSVLTKNPGLVARVQAACAGAFATPPEFRVADDGSRGAVVLALRHAGVTVDNAVFDRIGTTLASLQA